MQAAPAPFLQAIAPYREELVVCVACLCTWDWLADLCARQGLPCVLGHALSMTALHGGTATNDPIDAQTMAVWRRGGRLPHASGDPAERRATRDWRRRRMHLMRHRAALLAHSQPTNRQDHLPEIGTKLAYQAHRQGVATRVPEPAVQQRIDVDLALIDHDDSRLRDVERCLLNTAQPHDRNTRSLLRTIPGSGELWRVVLRDAIHAIQRFPRVQACVSDGRFVTWARESAGKRAGPSGTTMGQAALPWAFSEAAVLWLRTNPAGQHYLARLEKNHGHGNA